MIEASGLSLSRGGKQVLSEVSLHVRPGQVLGLLGRNGAGKTTTLRVLCGLLTPDSGEVRLAGIPLGTGSKRKLPKVGSLIETPGFYPNLTALENLVLFSSDRSREARGDLEAVLDLLGLSDAAGQRVGKYSLGMRLRLGIARALAGHPEVVILDEPTNGLDPHGIKDIRDLIRSLSARQGTSFLVSSHLLTEVEQIADAVTVIEEGRTVATLEVPRAGTAVAGTVEVEVDRPEAAARRILTRWPAARCQVVARDRITVDSVPGGAGVLNRFLVGAGHTVSLLVPGKWSLEALVMPLMKKER